MKLTCPQCRKEYDVPEGGDVSKLSCPACGAPQAGFFAYQKFVRFESVEDPAYLRAVEAARKGDRAAALAALEEAFRGGYQDFERMEAEPAFAAIRGEIAQLRKRFT